MKLSKLMLLPVAFLLVMVLALSVGCSSAASTTPTASATPAVTATATTTTSVTASPVAVNPGQVIKLNFALFQPATHGYSIANTQFAQDIQTRTNGRVQVNVLAGGALLAATDMYQGVRSGIADMGNSHTGYNAGTFPLSGVTELPVQNAGAYAPTHAFLDFYTKYQPKEWGDVHLLFAYLPGVDTFSIDTTKKQVKTLDDFKGLILRCSGPTARVVNALGGTTRDLPMGDTFDGISKGVVDGAIGSAEILKGWKFGDITKFVSLNTSGLNPSYIFYSFMNKAKWDSLPADVQQVINQLCLEYTDKLAAISDQILLEGLQYAKDQGDTVYAIPASETDKWATLITPIADAYIKDLTTKGFTQQEAQDALNYYKDRVKYWQDKAIADKVTPLIDKVNQIIGK